MKTIKLCDLKPGMMFQTKIGSSGILNDFIVSITHEEDDQCSVLIMRNLVGPSNSHELVDYSTHAKTTMYTDVWTRIA